MRYLKSQEVSEAARSLNVPLSPQHLANLRAARKSPLPFRKIGGRVFYRSDAVAEFLGVPESELEGRG